MNTKIEVPRKAEAISQDREVLDDLEEKLGFVPNLYASFTHSQLALSDFLTFQNRESSLSALEKEAIALLVSEINDCSYCLIEHIHFAKELGLSKEQIASIRKGDAPWNDKLDALLKFVQSAVFFRSQPSEESIKTLFKLGYTNAGLVDIILTIGTQMIKNFISATLSLPIDFPVAKESSEK